MTTYTRKCTICSDLFEYEQRPGRPPAFCTEHCKEESKRTKVRKCIVCDKPHETMNPFYCSEQCRTATTCAHCMGPSVERFCSHACLQAKYPPPYTCVQCERPFMPSVHWLQRTQSLISPPKYCSSACVELKHSATVGKSQRALFQSSEFEHALERWKLTGGPLPTTMNGLPWPYGCDAMHEITLPAREQNAVNFWRYALGGDDKRGQKHHPCLDITVWELLPEYLAYGAFTRGLMGSDTPTGIMRVWTVWPWIQDGLNLPTTAIINHLHVFNQVRSIERRRLHARSKSTMTELLQHADSVHGYWTGIAGTDDTLMAREARWINTWLKPKPEYNGHNRLYLECQLYLKAQQAPRPERWLPHLTNQQVIELEKQHTMLNAWATEQQQRRTKTLPWGPRLEAEPIEDRFQEVLNRVITGQLKVGT